MRATVHISDVGVLGGLSSQVRRPIPATRTGLVSARALVAAPLRDGRLIPRPQLGRRAVIGFWADDAAIDAAELEHLAGNGWSARLEPVRAIPVASGHFPGIPDDIGRVDPDETEPSVVLTIGRLRRRRAVPFFRASGLAEADAAGADGYLWSTGLADVVRGVVSTLSIWESGTAAHAYAVGTAGHQAALRDEGRRSFHHAGSFVRFRPYQVSGSLTGRNPLPPSVTAALGGAA